MLSFVAVSPDPPSLRSVQPFNNNIKELYFNNPNPNSIYITITHANTSIRYLPFATLHSSQAAVKTFMMFRATNERTLILLVLFDVAEVGCFYMRTIHRLVASLSYEIKLHTM